MESLEKLIINNFTAIIFSFSISWIALVVYGLVMQ